MSSSAPTLVPEVTWAQRSSKDEADKNFIYLTIGAPDVSPQSAKIDLQPGQLTFAGYSDTKKANYAVTIDFFAEIDPKESKIHHSARDVEIKLQKKELNEEYWPRLLKDKKRAHYLKTNFDKWVDEDEQDGAPDDDYMNQFGGAGGGMPGMGGDGGFGGLDFSKLGGGAGGMPDLSSLGGMNGLGGDDDDEEGEDGEEDEDMPALEGEDAGKGKIEELK
ncbi:hypothetical protein FH972_022414 [Carpinus fangiana]|uniref:Co-chaperone protein p23 n=1 Tax=Carpinus fangiana TaxID=176857 RepID=A0A5N6KS75_9ROSI|nr:hypothetical protein FH972_022414 [Carpinus fangiana]